MQRVRWTGIRWLAAAFVAALVMGGSAGVARAITHGTPDGNGHPYVGLAVFDDAGGNPLWRCSGTLLSPTIFLTAGHCTEAPAVRANIWFDSNVEAGIPGNGYPFGGPTSVGGTTYTHPQFDPANFYLHDLGVVVLDHPVVMDAYGALPSAGLLDALATRRGHQDTTFTAVGYGVQRINPVFLVDHGIRMQATVRLVDLNSPAGIPRGTAITVTANAHTGGTCFGDSGGPLLLNGTNVVAAVTSFEMNQNCAGIGGGYRVDTPDDLGWLYSAFGSQLTP